MDWLTDILNNAPRLNNHSEPELALPTTFTAAIIVYGEPNESGQIVTKQVAQDVLRQLEEHPEKTTMTLNNNVRDVPFVVKRAWLEEKDENTGSLIVEYIQQA